MDLNTVVVGNFSTSLSPIDKSSRKEIKKETPELNDTLDPMDLIEV
jgi:hypothetical protein